MPPLVEPPLVVGHVASRDDPRDSMRVRSKNREQLPKESVDVLAGADLQRSDGALRIMDVVEDAVGSDTDAPTLQAPFQLFASDGPGVVAQLLNGLLQRRPQWGRSIGQLPLDTAGNVEDPHLAAARLPCGCLACAKFLPRLFHVALERMGARADETAYVGDLYHVDVAGARAAGLHPVLLDPHGLHADKPCTRVTALAELARVL